MFILKHYNIYRIYRYIYTYTISINDTIVFNYYNKRNINIKIILLLNYIKSFILNKFNNYLLTNILILVMNNI